MYFYIPHISPIVSWRFTILIERKSNQHYSNHLNLQPSFYKSNQIKCWFLVRGENRSTRGKTSHSRVENQQVLGQWSYLLASPRSSPFFFVTFFAVSCKNKNHVPFTLFSIPQTPVAGTETWGMAWSVTLSTCSTDLLAF